MTVAVCRVGPQLPLLPLPPQSELRPALAVHISACSQQAAEVVPSRLVSSDSPFLHFQSFPSFPSFPSFHCCCCCSEASALVAVLLVAFCSWRHSFLFSLFSFLFSFLFSLFISLCLV
jgi:hypothetical protein